MTRGEILLRIWATLGSQFTTHWMGPSPTSSARWVISATENVRGEPSGGGGDGTVVIMHERRLFCVFAPSFDEVVEKALKRTIKFIDENTWTNVYPNARELDELLETLIGRSRTTTVN